MEMQLKVSLEYLVGAWFLRITVELVYDDWIWHIMHKNILKFYSGGVAAASLRTEHNNAAVSLSAVVMRIISKGMFKISIAENERNRDLILPAMSWFGLHFQSWKLAHHQPTHPAPAQMSLTFPSFQCYKCRGSAEEFLPHLNQVTTKFTLCHVLAHRQCS